MDNLIRYEINKPRNSRSSVPVIKSNMRIKLSSEQLANLVSFGENLY